jgi:hypothetical protein
MSEDDLCRRHLGVSVLEDGVEELVPVQDALRSTVLPQHYLVCLHSRLCPADGVWEVG